MRNLYAQFAAQLVGKAQVWLGMFLHDVAADLSKLICPHTWVIWYMVSAFVLQGIYADACKPQGHHLCKCASLLELLCMIEPRRLNLTA